MCIEQDIMRNQYSNTCDKALQWINKGFLLCRFCLYASIVITYIINHSLLNSDLSDKIIVSEGGQKTAPPHKFYLFPPNFA